MNTRKNSKLRKVNKNTRRNIKSMRGGNKIANDALREYAYSSDKEKFVEALGLLGLDMGPDDDVIDDILLELCKIGKIEFVIALLDGLNELGITEDYINIRDDDKEMTPLHWACDKGHTEVAMALVDRGADVDAKDGDKEMTPLHIACNKGYKNIALFLLYRGADINALDWSDSTPLHFACIEENMEIAIALIELDAQIDIRDDIQRTPLHYTCDKKINNLLAIALLDKGADVHNRDALKSTPLHETCKNGNLELTMTLLDRGANIEARDKWNMTPLHWACEKGQTELVITLIDDKNADIHSIGGYMQNTPLNIACRDNNMELAMALLDRGANIHTRNIKKITPLHYACKNGSLELAKALVNRGANIELKDAYKKTPTDYLSDKNSRILKNKDLARRKDITHLLNSLTTGEGKDRKLIPDSALFNIRQYTRNDTIGPKSHDEIKEILIKRDDDKQILGAKYCGGKRKSKRRTKKKHK